MHARKRRAINHIGGKDNRVTVSLRVIPCRQRAFDFPQRNGIHFDALLAHQAQNMNIRTCLLRKAHHVKLMQSRNFFTHDLRVVNPDRATKLGGQAQ
ncbi:hypothetical protein D3C76_1590950 [compost metagenome]